MHHHPNYWKDPETFDPERFANGTSEFVRNSYIPFIGGPRACLGKVVSRFTSFWPKIKHFLNPLIKLRYQDT